MAGVFTYHVLDGPTGTFLKTLRGVVSEPVFTGSINQGAGALTLTLDHYPSELALGNLVRVDDPSGTARGKWKYETAHPVLDASGYSYNITLTPLAAEATDCDFNANYSTDTTQPLAPLGTAKFSVPVAAAIPRTMHLTAGTINDDGVTTYGYTYNNCQVVDTLRQALVFGGASWWWYIDTFGVVTLRQTSPTTHRITAGADIIIGDWSDDLSPLYNGQPVIGAVGPDGINLLTALALDTNPANPYSVPNLGRRIARVHNDSSLVDQASVNNVAASLLTTVERIQKTRTITLINWMTKPGRVRPQPGDCIVARVGDPDPTSKVLATIGPMLITDVVEHAMEDTWQVKVSADLAVSPAQLNPNIAAQTYTTTQLRNPVSGAAASPTSVPHVPTGLTVTATGVDPTDPSLNTAYATLAWAANATTDAVTSYDVRWRISPAGAFVQANVATGISTTIRALFTGTTYLFSVRANNLAGSSAWSTEVSSATSGTAINGTPSTPTGLSATTGIDNIAQTNNAWIHLTWSANTFADQVTIYQVRWKKGTDTTYSQASASNNLDYKIAGLIQGISYNYSIRALNGGTATWSAWSADGTITSAQQTTPPAVPTGLAAIQTPRGAFVSWTANTEADLQGYHLQVNLGGAGFVDAWPGAAFMTGFYYVAPHGTATGTSVQFRLAALNWSNVQSAYCTAVTASGGTDGVIFDELLTGNIKNFGTITSTGGIQTGTSGARWKGDSAGIHGYDGTANNYGFGTTDGRTFDFSTVTGAAWMSGTVSASVIQGLNGAGGGSGARMWMQMGGTPTQSTSPVLSVSDGTNTRVQLGNLAASGNSPADYMVRANDSSGTPIFDSHGLIKACTIIGSSSGTSTGAVAANGAMPPFTGDALSSTATSFSLSRQGTVWVVATMCLDFSLGTGGLQACVSVVGIGNSLVQQCYGHYTTGGPAPLDRLITPCTCSYIVSLPAGSYTAEIFASVFGSSFCTIDNWAISVMLLGS